MYIVVQGGTYSTYVIDALCYTCYYVLCCLSSSYNILKTLIFDSICKTKMLADHTESSSERFLQGHSLQNVSAV